MTSPNNEISCDTNSDGDAPLASITSINSDYIYQSSDDNEDDHQMTNSANSTTSPTDLSEDDVSGGVDRWVHYNITHVLLTFYISWKSLM